MINMWNEKDNWEVVDGLTKTCDLLGSYHFTLSLMSEYKLFWTHIITALD